MKTIAVIQARMGSTRLPGKVLMKIGNETMLARVVLRAMRSELIQETIVATSGKKSDKSIVSECHRIGVPVYCGSEKDVLDRYYKAAKSRNAEAIVRITGDCPLIEPKVVDRIVNSFLNTCTDYASNILVGRRTYPRGLDCEVISMNALYRIWREAKEPLDRSHVTLFIRNHPHRFKIISVESDNDLSRYRWTVDTMKDLEFVRGVYAAMGWINEFGWKDVIELLDRKPELIKINQSVRQKTLEEI